MPVVFLLGALMSQQQAHAAADFRCTWALTAGPEAYDPRLAPAGKHRYLIQTTDGASTRAVLSGLRRAFPPEGGEVEGVRELRALGIFTARMTPAAVRWLCEREELDGLIRGVELDQAVAVGGRRRAGT